MLILSVLIYLALSILLNLRVYKVISFSHTVIFFFLTSVSLNILVTEILSLSGVLDLGWLFLVPQLLLCTAAGLLIWDPQQRIFQEKMPAIRFNLEVPRGWDWLLVLLIAGVLVLCLYIGALVPINNSDSLHTHLPRIYYWIQHGSLASWDAITVTQLNYPVNLSLQGVWLFLLGGSEKLLFLMPWLALLAAVVLIREIALQLGASRRGGLLAALISLSFPVVLLQTFSYQADVFVAPLVLASVFLLLQFIRGKQFMFAFLSLWPLAVALGTKQTAFLFLPFYLVILLTYLVREKINFRRWLVFGGVFLLLFGVFSSYKFIQNYGERDRLESSMFASYRYKLPFSEAGAGRRYATNALRYLYQGISVDGLTGSVKLAAERGREQAGGPPAPDQHADTMHCQCDHGRAHERERVGEEDRARCEAAPEREGEGIDRHHPRRDPGGGAGGAAEGAGEALAAADPGVGDVRGLVAEVVDVRGLGRSDRGLELLEILNQVVRVGDEDVAQQGNPQRHRDQHEDGEGGPTAATVRPGVGDAVVPSPCEHEKSLQVPESPQGLDVLG